MAEPIKTHLIKFTTTDWGENEYCFPVEPLTDYHDAALDHQIQFEIVQHMKSLDIKGKDQKYIYYDDEMNVIMCNNHALKHCKYEYPESTTIKLK